VTQEYYEKWQQETFKAIIKGYENALQNYNNAISAERANGKIIKDSNPGFYRQIENVVLRKNCISYLLDQTKTAEKTYGKEMSNKIETLENYEIDAKNPSLGAYTSFVKFMEQAFEWDIMSYNFYPYYWGSRDDWSELYSHENTDPLFRNFLQSGMARVIVTVRPGFEEAVNFYMQTGVIWNGGEVPVIDDKLFLSIVDELRQPEGKPEGAPWSTRVPIPMTILQAGSIGLKVEQALPYDYEGLNDFKDPDQVPQPQGFTLDGVGGLTGIKLKVKGVVFTHQYIDDNSYNTIGAMEGLFPRKYECMDEEIIIERDADWATDTSTAVVYRKLATQITLLTGIEAKQVTAANGNPCGIQFTIDVNDVKEFSFVKFPVSGPSRIEDVVYLDLTNEFFRINSPLTNLDRFVDAKGVALNDDEANTLLPVNRFRV
jgi:hypothetical protein